MNSITKYFLYWIPEEFSKYQAIIIFIQKLFIFLYQKGPEFFKLTS